MSKERESCEDIIKKVKRSTDASSQIGIRRLIPGRPGGINIITPCAACKLLRRRCAQECPFSPYFSPHEPHKFASVHKVFGASNVSKLLMEVDEGQRADAANSLVYEANVRLSDPVYGCMGVILNLQQQVQSLQAELNAIREEILKYNYGDPTVTMPSSQVSLLTSCGPVSVIVPPLPPPPPPLLPTPAPRPPLLSSDSSSGNYPPPTTAVNYSSITSDQNVTYFE